jgi:hypothetical protein
MPIQLSGVPFKLTPEDMGQPDYFGSITKGMKFPQDLREAILANQINAVKAQYAAPMAKEELTKAKKFNEYYGPNIESEMNLRNKQAGKFGKEIEWYDREAGATTGLQKSQTRKNEIEAQQNQMMMDALKSRLGPSQGGQNQNTGSMGGQSNLVGLGGQGQESPSTNSAYGIPNPSPTQDDIVNKKLFGIDTYTPRQTQAISQQQKQRDSFIKEIGESVQAANQAMKAKIALNGFNTAMDQATMKGPYWGTTPSSGWRTAYHPFTDFSQEQIADNMAANLLPGAMSEIKEAMGSSNFGVLDMQASQKLKVDRSMTDDARKNASNFINGVFSRMDERPKFYQTMNNPKINADKSTADLLWQNYQNDFPIMGDDGKTPKLDNLNMWPLFTSPKAIASVKETGSYKPTRGEKETFMMKYPNGLVLPVKRKDIGVAIRKGASSI